MPPGSTETNPKPNRRLHRRRRRGGVGLALLWLGSALLGGCSREASPPASPAAARLLPPQLPPEMQAERLREGKAIVETATGLLGAKLRAAIAEGGATSAIPYCSTLAVPLTQAVGASNAVTLKRVSHRPRNPAHRASPEEAELIRGYTEDLAAGRLPQPQLLSRSGQSLHYYSPIVLNQELCLQCHGQLETEVTLETAVVLRSLYPHDEATGFRTGQMRGLWRVDFGAMAASPTSPPAGSAAR